MLVVGVESSSTGAAEALRLIEGEYIDDPSGTGQFRSPHLKDCNTYDNVCENKKQLYTVYKNGLKTTSTHNADGMRKWLYFQSHLKLTVSNIYGSVK